MPKSWKIKNEYLLESQNFLSKYLLFTFILLTTYSGKKTRFMKKVFNTWKKMHLGTNILDVKLLKYRTWAKGTKLTFPELNRQIMITQLLNETSVQR